MAKTTLRFLTLERAISVDLHNLIAQAIRTGDNLNVSDSEVVGIFYTYFKKFVDEYETQHGMRQNHIHLVLEPN